MRFPFVSRLRLEFAELENQRLTAQVAELTAANAKAFELVQAEKELRIKAEARAEEEPEETTTRAHRMFGSEIRQRANDSRRAIANGKLKG